MPDKYTATWVSHSSMSDYLTCPRSYYLKNVYKDPKTNHKIKVMTPALALGQAVHETLEALSQLPTGERFRTPLPERFQNNWKKLSGKRGGFLDDKTEQKYFNRGKEMIARVYNHPGPIGTKAVKIKDDLPHYWLSEEEEIILCGKVDWLEYNEDTGAVHIIDFKTGKKREDESSLQLPIYLLLVTTCQKWPVERASYWYLDSEDFLTEKELPSLAESHTEVLDIARKIKLARTLEKFSCVNGAEGCRACVPFERVLRGEGEFVGEDDYRADTYILPMMQSEQETTDAEAAEIL